MAEKLACWICDKCRKIVAWKDLGEKPMTVFGKKRELHFCDDACRTALMGNNPPKMHPGTRPEDYWGDETKVATHDTSAVKVWFTSDTHFFHKNILQYSTGRPFATLEEMHRGLVERWNAVVGPRDVVYVLGDFSFSGAGKNREILGKLNGYKILVKGNHDSESRKMLSFGFDEVHKHRWLELDGIRVQLSHYPYWPKTADELPKKEYRFEERRPKDVGGWLLHGHVHEMWKQNGRMINVGVDVWNCQPVAWEELKKIIHESSGS